MMCHAYRVPGTTVAIAVLAGFGLSMSGTLVGVAADEGRGESPEDGAAIQAAHRTSWVAPPEGRTDAQDEGAGEETRTANYVATSSEGGDGKEDDTETLFRDDPKSKAARSKGKTAGKTAAKKAAKKADAGDRQDLFRSDPQYATSYDAQGQVDIYGAKSAVVAPRPPVELGRQQYTSGAYDESSTLLGVKNPLLPGLAVYGDWRTAVAYNNNNGKDVAQIATRLNLDVDFKITGTERIHAFFTPIQEDNKKFSRFEFGGGGGDGRFNGEFDIDPQTLFFEGDLGSLYSGFSGNEASFDLPFTVGLFPLFLQNGIWANDAILGGAVSLPAKNSAALGLANFDITFFAAFDNVDNAGIIGPFEADNYRANLYGVTAFIDAFDGYIETGYGLIQGRYERDGLLTHFLTAAYSRRYYNTVSNSTRVFANFGEDPDGNSDGLAIISENSLISGLPSTLLPYANFFVGFGNPQPLVDGNGAGILKNVGINFETDALTGYPKLDDTGSNAFGGAVGLQYLFNLDQQLVFEVGMVQPFEDDGIGAKDAQYGFGVRYQVPIDNAWLFRADATYQIQDGENEDNFGIRAEVRRKF